MIPSRKEKDVAGILALIFGFAGLHRFYLGQRGRGILYLMLIFTGISAILGLIDAFTIFSMDSKTFDLKYNRNLLKVTPRKDPSSQQGKAFKTNLEERNPHIQSGKVKFLAYDYDGAIIDFQRAVEHDPRSIAAHFNLACAYSLNEMPQKCLFHLERAVQYGFDDFEKIKSHEALAFIRIQPAFGEFARRGFRFSETTQEAIPLKTSASLEKLEELRLKGLLTEEEYMVQKMKMQG